MESQLLLRTALASFVGMETCLRCSLHAAMDLMERPCTGASDDARACLQRIAALLCSNEAVTRRLGQLFADPTFERHTRNIPPVHCREVLDRLRAAIAEHQRQAAAVVASELVPALRAEVAEAGAALAMAAHPRLGARSHLHALEPGLLAQIAAMAGLAHAKNGSKGRSASSSSATDNGNP